MNSVDGWRAFDGGGLSFGSAYMGNGHVERGWNCCPCDWSCGVLSRMEPIWN